MKLRAFHHGGGIGALAFASCTCGWCRATATQAEAASAAVVHRYVHRLPLLAGGGRFEAVNPLERVAAGAARSRGVA